MRYYISHILLKIDYKGRVVMGDCLKSEAAFVSFSQTIFEAPRSETRDNSARLGGDILG